MSNDNEVVDELPADRVYWISRKLVASRYGSYAKKEPETLEEIKHEIKDNENAEEAIKEFKYKVKDSVASKGGRDTKRFTKTCEMVKEIDKMVENREGISDLVLAIDAVIKISSIQEDLSQRKKIIKKVVNETIETDHGLDKTKAYEALHKVDQNGLKINLSAQREAIVDYTKELIEELDRDEEKVARVLSAVIQEYERRMGQSRVANAGEDLELALQHIFNRFNIPSTGDPEHHGDLEIDNKVEGGEGSIGFSCKRTLRERFRQSLSREADINVDEIWYVSLMIDDISGSKLRDMKKDGCKIHVPRDSYVWKQYGGKEEFEDVLRPADMFLNDVAEFTGNKLES